MFTFHKNLVSNLSTLTKLMIPLSLINDKRKTLNFLSTSKQTYRYTINSLIIYMVAAASCPSTTVIKV